MTSIVYVWRTLTAPVSFCPGPMPPMFLSGTETMRSPACTLRSATTSAKLKRKVKSSRASPSLSTWIS
jgi:hypothetical protein